MLQIGQLRTDGSHFTLEQRLGRDQHARAYFPQPRHDRIRAEGRKQRSLDARVLEGSEGGHIQCGRSPEQRRNDTALPHAKAPEDVRKRLVCRLRSA